MDNLPPQHPGDPTEPPAEPVTDLRALYGQPVSIPKIVDESMQVLAVRHAARIHRLKILLRWGAERRRQRQYCWWHFA